MKALFDEEGLGNGPDLLDQGLKDLAVLAATATIGCSWCADFGFWEPITRRDVLARKIRAIPDWQDSEVFTELERLVMLYAEAVAVTPPYVPAELVGQLRRHLGEAELAELTAAIHRVTAGRTLIS
jgi:alkylhydroperoxidase family enzyme